MVDNLGFAMFTASVNARDCLVGQAYSAPDYTLATAANVFSFAGASLFVAGSTTPVIGNMKFGIKSSSSLTVDRYFTGANGRKAEPLNAGWVEPVVTVDQEYADQITWVARNFTDESFSAQMDFVGKAIDGTSSETLSILCPAVKINGENPTVDGPDVLQHTLELPVLDNGTNPPMTLRYISRDTVA